MIKIGNIIFAKIPIILAPLEDITDTSFRKICKKNGADLMYTEFISSEGLIRDAALSLKKLSFDEIERPFGIQIFGHNPETMVQAALVAQQASPDLIDINFGCPVKKIVSKGAGAAMLKNIPLMLQITKDVVKAVDVPVTVKTRLGWDENNKPIVNLAEQLQDLGIAALTIHARTANQMYRGTADWTMIGQIKNNQKIFIPIIGNGDVDSPEKAKKMLTDYGVDGLMIGRAAIGNPWIFNQVKYFLDTGEYLPEPSLKEKIETCKIHLTEAVNWKGNARGVFEMRKHYGTYLKGYPGIKDFRIRLVTANTYDEVISILDEVIQVYC